jgi:hypothetical protein
MLELMVTTLCSYQLPALLLKQFDNHFDLHLLSIALRLNGSIRA